MLRPSHVRRSGCPIGLALDLVGDRWTLLVVRDLMFRGLREFGEFLRAGEGISTNILTDRLRRLASLGLVVQSDHPSDGKKFVYRLTEKGVDLAPILVQLTLWGAKHFPDHSAPPDILGRMRTAPDRLIGELRARLLADPAPKVSSAEPPKPPAGQPRLLPGSRSHRRPNRRPTARRLRKAPKTARNG